jgi:hypothetical protein
MRSLALALTAESVLAASFAVAEAAFFADSAPAAALARNEGLATSKMANPKLAAMVMPLKILLFVFIFWSSSLFVTYSENADCKNVINTHKAKMPRYIELGMVCGGVGQPRGGWVDVCLLAGFFLGSKLWRPVRSNQSYDLCIDIK